MFSFFRAGVNKAASALSAAKNYASHRVHTLGSTVSLGTSAVKGLFAAALGGLLTQKASAAICYVEHNLHYRVWAATLDIESEAGVALKDSCSAHYSDCNSDGETFYYGRGYFAGNICEITMNSGNTPSKCGDNALKDACTGIGSWQDIVIIIFIILGGLSTITIASAAINKNKQAILSLLTRLATTLTPTRTTVEEKDENDGEEDQESQLSRNRDKAIVAVNKTPSLQIKFFVKNSETASAGNKQEFDEKSSLTANQLN